MTYDFEQDYATTLKHLSTERLLKEASWVELSWVADDLKELATSLIEEELASRNATPTSEGANNV